MAFKNFKMLDACVASVLWEVLTENTLSVKKIAVLLPEFLTKLRGKSICTEFTKPVSHRTANSHTALQRKL